MYESDSDSFEPVATFVEFVTFMKHANGLADEDGRDMDVGASCCCCCDCGCDALSMSGIAARKCLLYANAYPTNGVLLTGGLACVLGEKKWLMINCFFAKYGVIMPSLFTFATLAAVFNLEKLHFILYILHM